MTDNELFIYCKNKFKENTFTGNEIVRFLKCSNSVHLQLFRLYSKNKINRFIRKRQTFYHL